MDFYSKKREAYHLIMELMKDNNSEKAIIHRIKCKYGFDDKWTVKQIRNLEEFGYQTVEITKCQ